MSSAVPAPAQNSAANSVEVRASLLPSVSKGLATLEGMNMRTLWYRFLNWFAPVEDDDPEEPPHDPQRITRLLWGEERMTIGGDK